MNTQEKNERMNISQKIPFWSAKAILEREKYTILFFLINFIALFISRVFITNYIEESLQQRHRYLFHKFAPVFTHIIPIVTISICYLRKQVNDQNFIPLLGISRGFLIYDIFAVIEIQTYSTELLVQYCIHHLVFIAITYFAYKAPHYVAWGAFIGDFNSFS